MHAAKSNIVRKHFRLNAAKLKHAQELLGAKSESEAIELAFDMAIADHERNRIVEEAHRNFVESRIVIRDVFGRLPK